MLNVNISDKDNLKFYYGLNNTYIDITETVKTILQHKNAFIITNRLVKKDPVLNKVKYLKVIYNNKEHFFKEKTKFRINYKLPNNVYNKDKVNEIVLNYKFATVFGKGPTFKKVEKKKGELRCAINQASNLINDVDLICMNDEHNVDLVKDNVYKNLKYLLIPEYQHVKQKFTKNGHWSNVYNKLKDKFNGIYIIYNLKTNPNPNNDFISLPSVFTSANNCVDFICINTQIKKIELYGIGINSKENYNKLFIGNGNYTNDRTNKIKSLIESICCKHKVKYIFN